MSKRAEEAALKAWPITMVTVEDSYGNPVPYDGASVNRYIYREGYEKAEKDTIKRACKWLVQRGWTCAAQISMFRKAMEEDNG